MKSTYVWKMDAYLSHICGFQHNTPVMSLSLVDCMQAWSLWVVHIFGFQAHICGFNVRSWKLYCGTYTYVHIIHTYVDCMQAWSFWIAHICWLYAHMYTYHNIISMKLHWTYICVLEIRICVQLKGFKLACNPHMCTIQRLQACIQSAYVCDSKVSSLHTIKICVNYMQIFIHTTI